MGWEDTIKPVPAKETPGGSWEDTIKPVGAEKPGILSHALERQSAYTDAPTRSALMAAVKGENPLSAGWEQMGKPAGTAPSGEAIAEQVGIPNKDYPFQGFKAGKKDNPNPDVSLYDNTVNPAKVAGIGIDIAADPKNLVLPAAEKMAGPIAEAATKVMSPMEKYMRALAESKAVSATGATWHKAQDFARNAGRELLDRGIVKFGSSQKKIAQRATQQLEESGQGIGETLKELEAKGVKVDQQNVVNAIRERIGHLSKQNGTASEIDQLEKRATEIEKKFHPDSATDLPMENAAESQGSETGIHNAELSRRNYDKNSKWESNADSAVRDSNKATANAYREANTNAAVAAEPELAEKFAKDKATYHLLDPIEEAAAKRAGVVSQSPHGGLMDVVTGGAGHAAAGPAGLLAIPVRRIIAPRIASSMAASYDTAANVLRAAPELLGKYGPILATAAAKGGQSLQMTHKILSETDPEYRSKLEQIQSGGGQ